MHLVMDEEVKSLAGERHQQHEATPRASLGQRGRLLRGGWPEGADPADAIAQRRQSRTALGELRTVSAQRAFAAGVWDKMMRGLSTRNYGAVVKDFQTPMASRSRR